jgi:hypothetical protein
MPNTTLVLTVGRRVPMPEVRRRLVALQHLDRPTPFSPDAEGETRAEAVLDALQAKNLLAKLPGSSPEQVRELLDQPARAISEGTAHMDDIAVLVLATLLHTPGTRADKVIGAALKTRGVIGARRTHARSEVVAQVVARFLPDDGARDARRSAFERICRWAEIRGLTVDPRPFDEIMADARTELKTREEARARGITPPIGHAIAQVAVRGAAHLIWNATLNAPLLRRSSHGAGRGSAREPGEVLRQLATRDHGLEQLGQAVFDGRAQRTVHLLEPGRNAHERQPRTDSPDEPDHVETAKAVSDTDLLDIASVPRKPIPDPTAATRVATDTDVLREHVAAVKAVVERIWAHRDDKATRPHVLARGWADPHNIVEDLAKLHRTLLSGVIRHETMNQSRHLDDDGIDDLGTDTDE